MYYWCDSWEMLVNGVCSQQLITHTVIMQWVTLTFSLQSNVLLGNRGLRHSCGYHLKHTPPNMDWLGFDPSRLGSWGCSVVSGTRALAVDPFESCCMRVVHLDWTCSGTSSWRSIRLGPGESRLWLIKGFLANPDCFKINIHLRKFGQQNNKWNAILMRCLRMCLSPDALAARISKCLFCYLLHTHKSDINGNIKSRVIKM